MLAKRIIPCLDVMDNQVVKGRRFKDHIIMGDILEYAQFYRDAGADELVFYDITASCENRTVSVEWVARVAERLDIPFCVAGGISSVKQAECIFAAGADKISINSPAIANPDLIKQLADRFGNQAIVVGIDSFQIENKYFVFQYTGSPNQAKNTLLSTEEWVTQVQDLGAGEIVLNCMNQDGMRKGFDIDQLSFLKEITNVPLVASGGAGQLCDFLNVFCDANVDGALAAGVFHDRKIDISELKKYLKLNQVEVRL